MKSFILTAVTVVTTILASTLPTIVVAQSTPENTARSLILENRQQLSLTGLEMQAVN
jgi:hypothetical protein